MSTTRKLGPVDCVIDQGNVEFTFKNDAVQMRSNFNVNELLAGLFALGRGKKEGQPPAVVPKNGVTIQ